MSKTKRLLSFILVLTMLATSCVFSLGVAVSAEANTEASTESGVTLTEEDKVIADKLATFGIINEVEEEAKLTQYLTRADMIPVLVQYLGLNNAVPESDTTPFLDVSVFDPQIGAYSMLYKAGYITGDDNKMYRPNDFITYNEAITLIVNAMGYKVFAIRNGGYPEGYLYTANKYGLLDGLRGNGQNPIPYCDLYKIMEASLEADAVVNRYFTGDGEGEFVLQKDVTVLEEIYNIEEIKGIVTGNENTRLYSSDSSAISMNQIEIENVVYDTPDQILADFLGRNVIAYAKENDEGDKEIIFIELNTIKNNEFTVRAEDLLKNKTTSTRIYYETEDLKEKHIDVNDTNLAVIYNGKSRSGYGSLKNTLPNSGYIVGVDNTGDDVIDVLFVYESKNMVVGTIDLYDYKFYDKYTGAVEVLDPDQDDIRVMNSSGNSMAFDEIAADSVLTIMTTDNAKGYKLISVYVSTTTVEGKIDEITSNGKYKIGDEYYELAYNLEDYIAQQLVPELKVGTTATFYLDTDGNIANYDRAAATSLTYGFVAGYDVKTTVGSSMTLKIYTQDAQWIEVPVASRVSIDGKRYNLGSDFATVENIIKNSAHAQVILFALVNNELGIVDTKEWNEGNNSDYEDTGNLSLIANGTQFEHRDGMCNDYNSASTNKFVVKDSCVIFSTPAEGDLLTETDDYSVTTKLAKNYYKPNGGAYAQAVDNGYYVYNTGKEDINVATCILLRGSKSSGASQLDRYTNFVVVSKISSAVDDEGENCVKLYYIANGAETSSLVKPEKISYSYARVGNASPTEVDFKDIGLEIGDVIQVGADADGYITAINVAYRYDQSSALVDQAWLQDPEYSLSFGNYDGEGAAVGRVKKVDAENGILQFSVGTGTSEAVYNIKASKANISICRYDAQKGTQKGEKANLAALMEGDLVIIRTSTGYAATAAQILVLK